MRTLIINKQSISQVSLRFIIQKNFKEAITDWVSHEAAGRMAIQSKVYDLVFIAIDEFGKSALELIKEINGLPANTKIIVYIAKPTYNQIVTYFNAGATGMISYDADCEEIEESVHAVLSSRTYLGSDLQELVIQNNFPYNGFKTIKKTAVNQFSDRERQVAAFLIEGKSTSVIASMLEIAKTTVSTHKSHIYSKTGANNIIELKEKIMHLYPGGKIFNNGNL